MMPAGVCLPVYYVAGAQFVDGYGNANAESQFNTGAQGVLL